MTNFVVSLHYASFFIVGSLLAKYQKKLKAAFSRLNGWWAALLLVAALCSYSFKWIGYGEDFHDRFMPHRGDWITAIGASIFFVAAISSARLSRQLQRKPLLFLGKISYSLYLYHMIVLLSLVHLDPKRCAMLRNKRLLHFLQRNPLWSRNSFATLQLVQ